MDSLLLAIGAAVVLLWAGIVLARGGLVGTALLVLLAGSCFGESFFHVAAGPLTLTADRLLLLVLIAQYALYRHWGQIDPRPLVTADYLLGGLLLVLVASTLVHDYRAHDWQPLSYLVLFYVMPAVLYWMARHAEWTATTAWWVFGTLAALGVYLGLATVAETHGAWNFAFPSFIAAGIVTEFFDRWRGPLLDPVAGGIVQSCGLLAALVWWPRANRAGKLLLAVGLVPLLAWGIYNTQMYSVWTGAACGTLIVVVLAVPRLWRMAVIGAAAAGCAVVLVAGWDHLLEFQRAREPDAAVAWQMLFDRPIMGCGLGHYADAMPAYLAQGKTDMPRELARPLVPHNVFLALLTETGLLGLGLFVGLLGAWTHAAWKLWRSAASPLWKRQMGLLFLGAMGVYLINGMGHDVSTFAMVNMFFFFLAGATMGLLPSGTGRVRESPLAADRWNERPEPALAGA